MQQTINLVANLRTRVEAPGSAVVIVSTGAVVNVELWLMKGSQELEYIRTAPRGFKARMGPQAFTHIDMRATLATAVEAVISDGSIDFDFVAGTSVQATIVGLPLAVSNDRGSVANPVNVTAVTVNDAPATAINNLAPVACSAVAAVAAAANANRRTVRFRNLGPDPVALGGLGITWASRVIVLNINDVWVEERAGVLAWYAITDAAKAASVTAQEVTA